MADETNSLIVSVTSPLYWITDSGQRNVLSDCRTLVARRRLFWSFILLFLTLQVPWRRVYDVRPPCGGVYRVGGQRPSGSDGCRLPKGKLQTSEELWPPFQPPLQPAKPAVQKGQTAVVPATARLHWLDKKSGLKGRSLNDQINRCRGYLHLLHLSDHT